MSDWKKKDDQYWREKLSPACYQITRQKGTEPAFTGKYNDYKGPGVFNCSNCGQELFDTQTKYDSGSGWPSFQAPLKAESVDEIEDNSYGMKRTEVVCSQCGAHLGHVFDDGPGPTGLRYCINSLALELENEDKD